MGKHLVLAGGGHAHLTVLVNLPRYIDRGHRVTLIGPSPYHYYSGMGPGLLSGIYRPQDVRFHVKKMAEDRGGGFLEDKIVRIEPRKRTLKLLSGNEVSYDIASFNTGSDVPLSPLIQEAQENVVAVKPVFNLLKARRRTLEALKQGTMRLLVLGGGPAGLEITANLWRLANEAHGKATIMMVAGRKLLGNFPDKVRIKALSSLAARDITVIEGAHAKEITKDIVRLSDGSSRAFDMAFLAVGIQPSPLCRDSGISVGPDGGMRVNDFLQSPDHPELFGGGDCISFSDPPLAKVGVYAVRQNPILHHNLLAALEGGDLRAFVPQKDYMLIFNMGNGRGLLWKRSFVWEGRLAFLLKDMIDRKFMKRFQIAGEADEKE